MSYRSDPNASLDKLRDITATTNAIAVLDDADVSAMRTTLGLAIDTDVQGYDAELAAIAGLTSADGKMIEFTGSGTAQVIDVTAAGKALIDDADASAQRTTLGLVIGTDVQAHGDVLDDLNTLGVASADGEFLVATGAGAMAWESGSTARDSIGLGASNNVEFANLTIQNLYVEGNRVRIDSEVVYNAANSYVLNAEYSADTAQAAYLVFNIDPSTTQTNTVGAGVFTAGVDGVSDPTVTTAGSGTFAQGDIILLSDAGNNRGLYEVHDHTGTTLTVRSTSAGVTNRVEGFTLDDFIAETDTGVTITKVAVSVIKAETDGSFSKASGSTTGLSYSAFLVASDNIDMSGALTTDQRNLHVANKADTDSPYAVLAADDLITVDTTNGTAQINLPASAGAGRRVQVKNIGGAANDVTVDANGTEKIDGALTATVADGDCATFVDIGVTDYEWAIV